MSKFKFTRSKFSRFMASKGFYAAIAICLVGAGAATWMAVDRTITGISDSNSEIIRNDTSLATFPPVEEVEKKQPDIPKVSTSSSSSQKPVSSSQPQSQQSSKPAEQSAPVQQQPQSPGLVYSLPVKGDVINQFSNGELVKNKTLKDWRTHDGVDIAAEKGDSVYAAADGIVSEVRKDSLWGTVVAIDHADGKQSIYCGLSEVVPVKVGEPVIVRQVIGSIEGIPCEMSEKPHLHFALKQEGKWIDPLSILAKAPA